MTYFKKNGMIWNYTKALIKKFGLSKFIFLLVLLVSCSFLDLFAFAMLFDTVLGSGGTISIGVLFSKQLSFWLIFILFLIKMFYFGGVQYLYFKYIFNAMGNILESSLKRVILRDDNFKSGKISLEKTVLQNVKSYTEGFLVSFFNFWADIILLIAYICTIIFFFHPIYVVVLFLLTIVCVLMISILRKFSDQYGKEVNTNVLLVSTGLRQISMNQEAYSVEKTLERRISYLRKRILNVTKYNRKFIFTLYQARQLIEVSFVFTVIVLISLREISSQFNHEDLTLFLAFILRVAPVINRVNIATNNLSYFAPIVREVELLEEAAVPRSNPWDIEKEILQQVDDMLMQNSICVLTGPSGIGKTTLLNKYLEKSFKGFPESDIQSSHAIRYFCQDYYFAATDLMTFLNLNQRDVKSFINWLKEFFPVSGEFLIKRLRNNIGPDENLIYENAENFSGGESTRLRLLRDLYAGAKFYAIDEPTTGFGSEMIDELVQYIDRMRHEGNFLIVTHEKALITKFFEYEVRVPSGHV